MTRVVSLYLPTWATDRIRRTLGDDGPPRKAPLVVIGRNANRRVLTAVDHAAYELGLRKGMPATKAQALVEGLVTKDADDAADAMALEKLAVWALRRYSPIVAVDSADGIVIDTTGSDHLHGGEDSLLKSIVAKFDDVGIDARVAIADTWGTAHAAARFLSNPIAAVPTGKNREVLEDLPIAALRMNMETVRGLSALGFDRVCHLLAQPRAPLTLRFGPELWRRIDQAMGSVAEPIDAIRVPGIVEVRRSFADPIGAAETIARYIGKLVQQLCSELEKSGLGVRQLDLICHRVDSHVQALRVGTALPVRDVKALTRLLSSKISSIDPGFGIEILSLTAVRTQPLAHKQSVSSLVGEPDDDVSGLIDLLANRVGASKLYRFAPISSDVPERSVSRVSALIEDDGQTWSEHWPRPARLFSKPEQIETVALLPDHPPASFTWRGIRRRVRRADGPERVFGEWWKRDSELSAVRDYFQVEDENGERFWIFRAGDGEDAATGSHKWFLHGVFG